MVILDHMHKFQECIDSYKIGNGVHPFDMIALAIVFCECTCNVHLIVTVQHTIIGNVPANNICTFHVSFPDLLQERVHGYYRNKCMQQIYGNNIFPIVQDQIRYDGETIIQCWEYSSQDDPKLNKSAFVAIFLILMNPQLSALSVERRT